MCCIEVSGQRLLEIVNEVKGLIWINMRNYLVFGTKEKVWWPGRVLL